MNSRYMLSFVFAVFCALNTFAQADCDPVFRLINNEVVVTDKGYAIQDISDQMTLSIMNKCKVDLSGLSYSLILIPKQGDPVMHMLNDEAIEKNRFLELNSFPIRVYIENIEWDDSGDKANAIAFTVKG